jgi:hypothetical protein
VNKATLKSIADEVLKGRPEAAIALPPNSLVRVHILVAEGVKARGSFENLYKYFSALPRFQRALMWLIFIRRFNSRQGALYSNMICWYNRKEVTEVICNSLFCSAELHNGKWVKDNKPIVYEAKCDSFDKIMSYCS